MGFRVRIPAALIMELGSKVVLQFAYPLQLFEDVKRDTFPDNISEIRLAMLDRNLGKGFYHGSSFGRDRPSLVSSILSA